jgi:hypothetical protein
MSSTNLNTVTYSDSHRRTYITTAPFSSEIFSYSPSMNAQFVTVGSLTAKSVPSGLNIAGIILRENGRKLYPGANPGVNTYMVGVYHDTIGSGFIDPNAHVFAVYNSSKPYFAADGVDPATAEKDNSAPVYTNGIIYAKGDITTSSDLLVNGSADISGGLIVRGSGVSPAVNVTGNIVATTQIRSSTVSTITPVANVVVNPLLGQVHKLTTNQNTSLTVSSFPAGAVIYLIIQGDTAGRTIDFNNGFRSENLGNFTINANLYTFTFVCDGSVFYQVGQALNIAL